MNTTVAPKGHFADLRSADSLDTAIERAARIAINDSLAVKAGEKVLIITNPRPDVSRLSGALYDAALDAGARPVLIYQDEKTQMDGAEEAVIAAFGCEPEVVISMSSQKLGKDRAAAAKPIVHEGKAWDHVFHYLMYGKKNCRSFWSPGVTIDSFIRTVPIDYPTLKRRSAAIKAVLDRADAVRVTAPAGTDITLGLKGRLAFCDDGNFSVGGSGGNLPAGETFISPENGTANGTIAYDGSISLHDGEIIIREPIVCRFKNGFIERIEGGTEADALRNTVEMAQRRAIESEESGKLPKGSGAVYAKNAGNLGELGIGLNPEARISGNMLEDEKAFRTCHFAIGLNYDDDAPALIHLDGLVKEPTITAILPGGKEIVIEKNGVLQAEFD